MWLLVWDSIRSAIYASKWRFLSLMGLGLLLFIASYSFSRTIASYSECFCTFSLSFKQTGTMHSYLNNLFLFLRWFIRLSSYCTKLAVSKSSKPSMWWPTTSMLVFDRTALWISITCYIFSCFMFYYLCIFYYRNLLRVNFSEQQYLDCGSIISLDAISIALCACRL